MFCLFVCILFTKEWKISSFLVYDWRWSFVNFQVQHLYVVWINLPFYFNISIYIPVQRGKEQKKWDHESENVSRKKSQSSWKSQKERHWKKNRDVLTCRPTLIFLVSAPCGKTACTCGTTVLDTIPPSGPMAWTSWRMRDTTAKYCGKSYVTKRQIRPPDDSSIWLISETKRD